MLAIADLSSADVNLNRIGTPPLSIVDGRRSGIRTRQPGPLRVNVQVAVSGPRPVRFSFAYALGVPAEHMNPLATVGEAPTAPPAPPALPNCAALIGPRV